MSRNKSGWVKVWRPITEHWLWQATKNNPFSQGQAWIDLILRANHRDMTIMYNGKPYLIKRGSTLTSMQQLADRWHWSRGKVDRYIKRLCDEKMLTTKRKENGTILTVENYGKFQGGRATDEQPTSNRRATDEQPTNTNNNIKINKEFIEGKEVVDAPHATEKNIPSENIPSTISGIGKNVIVLSEKQMSELLELMPLNLFDEYVEKLADFIINKNAKIKNHCETIKKWYCQDYGIEI